MEQCNWVFTRHMMPLAVSYQKIQICLRDIRDVIHRRCVGISIRSTVIVRISEIFKIMCHCNALFERINWIICARARTHFCERPFFLFFGLFFFSKTSRHRNGICIIASDCLSSYHGRHIHASGPSVRSSDPDSYANGWVHRRTTAWN